MRTRTHDRLASRERQSIGREESSGSDERAIPATADRNNRRVQFL